MGAFLHTIGFVYYFSSETATDAQLGNVSYTHKQLAIDVHLLASVLLLLNVRLTSL